MFVHYENGVITATFRNPQPDAVDDNGVVLCPGVSTVELPNNHPDVVAYLSQTLAEIKAGCLAAVDTAAAKLDAKYLTVGGMQGAVYRIKEEQARAYKAAGYPVLAEPLANTDPAFLAYGHVRQYRETLRLTNPATTDQAAADAIIVQADQMARLSIARERRLTFKQQIRDAATAAAAQAALDAALAELGAL